MRNVEKILVQIRIFCKRQHNLVDIMQPCQLNADMLQLPPFGVVGSTSRQKFYRSELLESRLEMACSRSGTALSGYESACSSMSTSAAPNVCRYRASGVIEVNIVFRKFQVG